MFQPLSPRLGYFLLDFSGYLIFTCLLLLATPFVYYLIIKNGLSEKQKKLLLSFVTFIFLIGITFTISEAYFRYIYDVSDGLGFLRVNQKWQQRHVVYNSYFFRDHDFKIEKKEGITRIGVLGDSITFGGGIENVNNRFSNLLEQKLKNAGYNVEIYNLGKPGYDTDGEIQEYQKVKDLNFDIIIWEYFLNDIQLKGKSTGTDILDKASQKGKVVNFLSNKSYFFDYFYWRLASRWQRTLLELRTADLARYHDTQALEIHKMQIAQFIEDLKQDNKKVVVVIFPLFAFLGPDYPATNIHHDMGGFFQDNGSEVIDLLDYLKGKNGRDLWASQFDSHPNEAVHALAAEKIFEKISPLLTSPSPN